MKKLEREMIQCGRWLFDRRLVSGWGGNLSCRMGQKEYLITGQHAPLGFLTPRDLVRVNGAGETLTTKCKASSETPLHMAVYGGTDAQAVIHAHPPTVVAFSLSHDRFDPVSFEEKFTLGDVPIVTQDTPTVTTPALLVEELRYRPVIIIKGHGTVAIGKSFQEAFLFTDLLEEAVRCRLFTEQAAGCIAGTSSSAGQVRLASPGAQSYRLFSREHMAALVESANCDREFRSYAEQTALSASLTLRLEENDAAWTVCFDAGAITQLRSSDDGEFMISGPQEWWTAVFRARIDPFLATQQGKLRLQRGELARLSRWYKPFQRAFTLWQTIPIQ